MKTQETLVFSDIEFAVRVSWTPHDGRAVWIDFTVWRMHGHVMSLGSESFDPLRPDYLVKGSPHSENAETTFNVDEAMEFLSGVIRWDGDCQWSPGEEMCHGHASGSRRDMLNLGLMFDRIHAISRALCQPREGETWMEPVITPALVAEEQECEKWLEAFVYARTVIDPQATWEFKPIPSPHRLPAVQRPA